jgi:MFS family permease
MTCNQPVSPRNTPSEPAVPSRRLEDAGAHAPRATDQEELARRFGCRIKAEQAEYPTKVPSRSSRRGLDWFTFFVADIQTGFGPFLSVYLTTQKWTQVDIGLVLSIGSLASLLGQVPGGWLVDQVRSKLRVAALAVIVIGVSALLIALAPMFVTIATSKLMHVASSSVLGPAVAAITLGLVGHASVGPRLGRNARFAAIGNGLAAGVMGACGYSVRRRPYSS